jgi:hypothetical protein
MAASYDPKHDPAACVICKANAEPIMDNAEVDAAIAEWIAADDGPNRPKAKFYGIVALAKVLTLAGELGPNREQTTHAKTVSADEVGAMLREALRRLAPDSRPSGYGPQVVCPNGHITNGMPRVGHPSLTIGAGSRLAISVGSRVRGSNPNCTAAYGVVTEIHGNREAFTVKWDDGATTRETHGLLAVAR